ncbi:hypothetical protein RY831_14475 [Noviherbaspirillum sp. CPCC 100848]|uniref:Uncharacterized protein n=1 Tax=Noviherbaspirillum album TaxID=3080276 RepID=A0ABU6J9P3_9BURK|nr:hypothetical protein [Noviherbaspirillum sp. CPCC 100848]MEC4720364.1 hypothetical protein [Noviherbaspirillum sp. CPCC 100848]
MKASTPAQNLIASTPVVYLRAAIYLTVILCFLAFKVTSLPIFGLALSGASLLSIVVSLPVATPLGRTIAMVFVSAGGLLLWRAGLGFREFIGAYGQMAYLIALFAVLPILAAPIRLGGYSHAIQSLMLGRVKTKFSLNCITTSMAYLCGSFVSMAAIPIMMACMRPVVDNFPLRSEQRFMTVSAISGYVLPLFWTPVSGIVGVVLQSLRMDWFSLFPLLLLLSLVCLGVNWLIFSLIEGSETCPPDQALTAEPSAPDSEYYSSLSDLMQMVFGIFILLLSIVVLEHWMRVGLVTVVTLLAIPAALIWCMLLGKGKRFASEGSREFFDRLPRMADQYAVFLSAGFLATAIALSGTNHMVNELFIKMNEVIGAPLLLLFMPVIALAVSFVGVHPLVGIALLGEALRPEVLGISSTQLAITLVGSSVLTFMLGPFSGTLGLVQTISNTSTFRLAWWNAPYAAGYFCVLCLFILLV